MPSKHTFLPNLPCRLHLNDVLSARHLSNVHGTCMILTCHLFLPNLNRFKVFDSSIRIYQTVMKYSFKMCDILLICFLFFFFLMYKVSQHLISYVEKLIIKWKKKFKLLIIGRNLFGWSQLTKCWQEISNLRSYHNALKSKNHLTIDKVFFYIFLYTR